MDILKMGLQELLELKANDVSRFLTPDEIVHMAKTLGAFWSYDYEAAKRGKVGMHAILKSDLHSDAFFVSKILLAPANIRRIISCQMAMRVRQALGGSNIPDCVAGVQDGATKIGEDISEILGARNVKMAKVDGRISLVTPINPGESVLLVEDFCTRGTGFMEAVRVLRQAQVQAQIFPYNPVILNRGGLEKISIEGVGEFKVLPVVELRVQDWDPSGKCPLCDMGSVPIKPKATDENWKAITTSQL